MPTDESATANDVLQVLDFLQQHGLEVWLHGGWALEALTNIPRPHNDIDLLTDEANRNRLRQLFGDGVLSERMHKMEVEFNSVILDIVFFHRALGGRLLTFHPKLVAAWPRDLLTHGRMGAIAGRQVPVISPGGLFIEISHNVGKNQQLLEKNRRDRELFKDLLPPSREKELRRIFPRKNTFLNRLRARVGL